MRRVPVDTSVFTFMVTKSAQPKTDQEGSQKFVKNGDGKGAPMWQVEILALDKLNEGGETLNVTVAGIKPELTVGQMVSPVGLIAIPWKSGDRSGLAYKADELTVQSNVAA